MSLQMLQRFVQGYPVHWWFLWNVGCVIRSWMCSFAKWGGNAKASTLQLVNPVPRSLGICGRSSWWSSWVAVASAAEAGGGVSLQLSLGRYDVFAESLCSFQDQKLFTRFLCTHPLSLFVSPFKSGLYSRWYIFYHLLFVFAAFSHR